MLDVANINSPGQIVVAGHRAAVERAVALAPARGGKRSVLLPVSAPFHCRLMTPAAERLDRRCSPAVRTADPRSARRPQRGRGAHHAGGRRAALPDPPGDGAGPLDGLRRAHGARGMSDVRRGGAGQGADRAPPAHRRRAHRASPSRTWPGSTRPWPRWGPERWASRAAPGGPSRARSPSSPAGRAGSGAPSWRPSSTTARRWCSRAVTPRRSRRPPGRSRAGPARPSAWSPRWAGREDVQRIVADTDKRFDRIDLLVNNAGITKDGLLIRMKDADWDEVLGRQPPGRVPGDAGGRAPHDPAALRADRQRDLGGRRHGHRRARPTTRRRRRG